MNNETQLFKGILEGCILSIVNREEVYGYRAVEILNRAGFAVNEATVYPILVRLQNKGYLRVEKRSSPYGPDRKYYFLTAKGAENLTLFQATWARLSNLVNQILEGEQNDR